MRIYWLSITLREVAFFILKESNTCLQGIFLSLADKLSMAEKAPEPIFEVVFQGIYPERIPLGTLSRILSAVQRLASGSEPEEDEEQLGEAISANGQIQ